MLLCDTADHFRHRLCFQTCKHTEIGVTGHIHGIGHIHDPGITVLFRGTEMAMKQTHQEQQMTDSCIHD